MIASQNRQNPDVNTFIIGDTDSGESSESNSQDNGDKPGEEIPLPPETESRVPIEEPPGSDGPPVGDVDDSPKKIA